MRTPAGKDRLSDIYAKICHAETWIILDELSHFSGMAQTQSSVSEILIKNNESFFKKKILSSQQKLYVVGFNDVASDFRKRKLKLVILV